MVDDPSTDEPAHSALRERMRRIAGGSYFPCWNDEEILAAISRLRTRNAPGNDRLEASAVKICSELI